IAHQDPILAAMKDHWKVTAAFPVELPIGKRLRPTLAKSLWSIVLAVVFWSALTLSQSEIVERVFTIAVEYAGIAPNLVLVDERETQVRIRVAGAKSVINELAAGLPVAKINLSGASTGRQKFLITEESIRLPKGVEVIDIVPSIIDIDLTTIVEREVLVNPQLVGTLRGGLTLDAMEVSPRHIKALVPASATVEKTLSVTTTPIYLESISGDAAVYCKIIAPPEYQPLARRWPDVVVRLDVSTARR
ncbi:MAG: hypothetical protein HKP58_07220, partial [Desulfatitalea sp.]|nr:hypothetical protein [Desulfatitalea sp.]NNK00188.1 hypothetical protein [Desulfatitalea sp.]